MWRIYMEFHGMPFWQSDSLGLDGMMRGGKSEQFTTKHEST